MQFFTKDFFSVVLAWLLAVLFSHTKTTHCFVLAHSATYIATA